MADVTARVISVFPQASTSLPTRLSLKQGGIVPLAGNTVTFATQLKLRPGEAATVVLESTVFAVVYIPFMFWLLGVSQ